MGASRRAPLQQLLFVFLLSLFHQAGGVSFRRWPYACQTPLGPREPCVEDSDCELSLHCHPTRHMCSPPLGAEEPCNTGRGCAAGLGCKIQPSMECFLLESGVWVPTGRLCTEDSPCLGECQSPRVNGSIPNGVCKALPSGRGECLRALDHRPRMMFFSCLASDDLEAPGA
jgi:hypothetical protein